MTAFVRTVRGDLPAHDFRHVLMHEHVLWDIVPPDRRHLLGCESIDTKNRWQTDYRSNENPENALQQDVAVATEEIGHLAGDGGDLIVDQSTYGLARDPAGLQRASDKAGIAVVACAGTYTAAYLDEAIHAMDVDGLTERFVQEVDTGLDGTTVKAGLIGEIGCSAPLEEVERRALKAAARASRRTGAGISVHPGRHTDAPFEIVDILGHEGAELSRVAMCHMDRTYPTGERVAELAAAGVAVEWDFFGIEQSHYWMGDVELPTDRGRLRLIRDMFERGLGHRVLVSQDICTRTRLLTWGGHGYGHMFRNVVPLMKALGFAAAEINQLISANPLHILAMPGASEETEQ
ncbi:MAG: aryldialkylphosphatase [Alphaproteobacteria bacterium]|nr:aryldialkylphosphatase [Alphaproteobacteria bacterium]